MSGHEEEAKKISEIAAELGHPSAVQEVDVAHLDDSQRAQLTEMRELIGNALDAGEVEADNWLLKFLKFHSFDAAKAAEAYVAMRKWRVEKKVDQILDSDLPGGDLMRMVTPHGYVGTDKEGRPIYVEKSGKIHVDALLNAFPLETVVDSHVYGLETLRRRMAESSAKRGETVDQFVTILDLAGLGLYHGKALTVLKALQDLDNTYYPEAVGPIYIVNAPWIMPTLWEMVKPILNESIKAKIHVCGANFKEELREHIEADQLPEEYGGTSDQVIGETPYEEVRQFMLRDASGLSLAEQYIAAGGSFEKELEGVEGDVFVWSFEADTGYDVGFSVTMTTADGATVMVKPESRCNSSKGEYAATGGCKLVFKWDNSFSYFNGKNLKFHASVVPAKEHTDE